MSELRQYHPSLRVFKIKQTQNGWIFRGDTLKDFVILQNKPKTQQVFQKNVKVSLPKSDHSADAIKGKVLVVKGVSNNVTIEDHPRRGRANEIKKINQRSAFHQN